MLAKFFQYVHILIPADVKRVVDHNQCPTVLDQRTHLVDQPRALAHLVYFAFGGRGKEWGIDDNAVKYLVRAFEFCRQGEEIRGDEIRFMDGETIQCIRGLGNVQELAVEVMLDDARRSACQRRDAETACVSKCI